MTSARALLPLLLLAIVFLAPPLQAGSIATTDASLTDLTITPSAGTLMFIVPFTASASALAQETLEGPSKDSMSALGALAQANATLLFASGQASADPANLLLANPATPLLSSSSSANFNQPNGGIVAYSTATADFPSSTFEITGGKGPVMVNFGATLKGTQSLTNTGGGFDAISSVLFELLVNGQQVLFLNSFEQVGKNSSLLSVLSTTLASAITLQYGQSYTILVEDVSQAQIYDTPIPEPSALSLLFGGPGLVFVCRWIAARRLLGEA